MALALVPPKKKRQREAEEVVGSNAKISRNAIMKISTVDPVLLREAVKLDGFQPQEQEVAKRVIACCAEMGEKTIEVIRKRDLPQLKDDSSAAVRRIQWLREQVQQNPFLLKLKRPLAKMLGLSSAALTLAESECSAWQYLHVTGMTETSDESSLEAHPELMSLRRCNTQGAALFRNLLSEAEERMLLVEIQNPNYVWDMADSFYGDRTLLHFQIENGRGSLKLHALSGAAGGEKAQKLHRVKQGSMLALLHERVKKLFTDKDLREKGRFGEPYSKRSHPLFGKNAVTKEMSSCDYMLVTKYTGEHQYIDWHRDEMASFEEGSTDSRVYGKWIGPIVSVTLGAPTTMYLGSAKGVVAELPLLRRSALVLHREAANDMEHCIPARSLRATETRYSITIRTPTARCFK